VMAGACFSFRDAKRPLDTGRRRGRRGPRPTSGSAT
jgi:hypothetical protein